MKMAFLKQLALEVGVLLLCLSLQHYSVNSQPMPDDLRDDIQNIISDSNSDSDKIDRILELITNAESDDTDCTYTECMKVDEKELVHIYNSRYPGAKFYSSSCLYLLHYMIPVGDSKSNATSVMPRYVGLVSSEGRCLNLSKVVHDQECLNTSHPQYQNDSYCDWNYSLRYLGENRFPRYIVELECNTSNSDCCIAIRIDISIRVLKRLDGCSKGFENWSSTYTQIVRVTAGCNCVHMHSG